MRQRCGKVDEHGEAKCGHSSVASRVLLEVSRPSLEASNGEIISWSAPTSERAAATLFPAAAPLWHKSKEQPRGIPGDGVRVMVTI